MISRHQVEAARARADAATKSPWQWVDPDNDARADLPAALDALEEVMEVIRGLLAARTFLDIERGGGHSLHRGLRALLAAYDADAPTRAGDGGEG